MTLLQTPSGHVALRRGRDGTRGGAYHLTFVTAGRRPWFRNPIAAREAATCFNDPVVLGGACMLAWVVMPDHAHLLVDLGAGLTLASAANRLKSASARRVNLLLGRRGALWSRAYHDRGVRREDDLRTIATYIVANPVRAELVQRLEAYPWWGTARGRVLP